MPELKKTSNSFNQLSEADAKKVLEKFNLVANKTLLPPPDLINTYHGLFEAMNAAANLVRMNQIAILETSKALKMAIDVAAGIKPIISDVQLFALGITSKRNNLQAFAIGITAEINGPKSFLQVIQGANERWNSMLKSSFLDMLPPTTQIFSSTLDGHESKPNFFQDISDLPKEDWEIDYAYIEQVRKEEDEIRKLKLQYWRHKVQSLQAPIAPKIDATKRKELPEGVIWFDQGEETKLTFSSGQALKYVDPKSPSARYLKLLINNYGFPVQHSLAMNALSCTKQQIKNLVKALKEKINRSGLNNRIKLSTQFSGAYTLEILI